MKTAHRIGALFAFGLLAFPMVAQADSGATSRGTDFWVMFDTNYGTPALSLFIAGDTSTTGIVSIPGLGFSAPFSVTPGAVTTVAVPSSAAAVTQDGVESKGIHITANSDVSVYGLNRIQATTDAFLGLPTKILGTEYIVLAFPNTNIVNATEFGVAATQDGTTVTITPSATVGGHTAGVPYSVVLNAGQIYQLMDTNPAPADLTGSIVTSSAPVAVFGAHECANIPNGSTYYCDHIVEELTPTSAWGRNFVTMPLATRTQGDTFRMLAQADGTQVSVNGAIVATLNRAQVWQQIITGPSQISATKPVLVAQYSNGSTYDGVTSDPFMMLIPPYEQFLPNYTVTTPATGFSINYINVVVASAGVGGIVLDGVAVPSASFTSIGSSGFSGVQLPVGLGSHTLKGTLPFGAFIYGFDSYDSYGYPGGMSLSPVAVVTTLKLAPKTATDKVGTNDCVTATVLDQSSNPLQSVRVDFAVSGPNAQLGFTNTAADGTAKFCYTGVSVGTDTIVASVGTLTDSATKTWTSAAPTPAPSCALTKVVAGPPKQLLITVQDSAVGIQSIKVTESTNTSVVVPAFTPGDKSAMVVVATKINQAQGANVALSITGVDGQVTNCDPVVPADALPDSAGGCNIGRGGTASNLLGLLAALAGLAFLRRRRASAR